MTTLSSAEHNLKLYIPHLVSLWRNNSNAAPLSPHEIKTAGSALLSLQRGLTGTRKLAGAGYMDDSGMLGAYMLYYWPVSYMQTYLACSCAADAFTALHAGSLRILDLGSGPGPASCAVADFAAENAAGISTMDVTLIDSGSRALALAQKILAHTAAGSTIAINTSASTADFEHDFPLPAGPYDIIVMSHALNELWTGDSGCLQKRARFIEKAASLLSPSGIFVIIEPALLETSRNLLALRDMLSARGFSILAPCLNSVCSACTCPALAAGPSHTCHAEVPWHPVEPVASLAGAAGLDRESVKMSFIIMSKRSQDEAAEKDSSRIIARVVSDGMLNKSGRIRYLLCNGRTRTAFSAKNGDASAKAAGFFTLRRHDIVEICNPELRGDAQNAAYGFGSGTQMRIISRMGD